VGRSHGTLAEALDTWTQVGFRRLTGRNTVPSAEVDADRQKTLRRVLKALNDHEPVVMSLMIDFNALDAHDATFHRSTLAEAGGPGRQGGHMVVLDDYAVTDAPGYGDIGIGDMPEAEKAAALD